MQRIFTIFLRQFFLIKRSWNRIVGIFYWSLLELLIWGIMTAYLDRVGNASFSFVAAIFGVVILWNMLFRIQHGVTVSFLEDVWTRNLVNLFTAPLSIHEYVAGLLLTSFLEALVAFAFLSVVSWLIFSYNIFQFGFLLILFFFILYLFGWALGILATAMILRFGPSTEILAWSIPALLTPLSSVFYPISALPKVLQPIASFIPTAQVFEGMRALVLKGSFDPANLLVSFFLSAILLAISYAILLVSYRSVLRKGLFTRFLTE